MKIHFQTISFAASLYLFVFLLAQLFLSGKVEAAANQHTHLSACRWHVLEGQDDNAIKVECPGFAKPIAGG